MKMKGNKVNIVTLGCSKNLVDSQKLMRQLVASGYSVVNDSSKPSDIVIINTCGFIMDAKQESIDTIIAHANSISERGEGRLIVMGCMAERYKEDLISAMPEVKEWFGVNKPEEIIAGLGKVYHPELTGERILTGPGHYAYLKIAEGCDRTCAFCAIPGIRGRYNSTPVEKLVEEARFLASQGVKELILIAQDLSYYGIDLYGKQKLTDLVRELAMIEKIEWIRLHYLYPSNFPMDLLDLMKSDPKICRYIDIPIQHISDNILKKMRRAHGSADTKKLLKEIRTKLPDAVIRTTVIAGHPGESDENFSELLGFIKDFRFDRLGAFRYSHEEDTYGFLNYTDDIPEKTKEKRVSRIMKLQQKISGELNEKRVGETISVIIDRKEGVFYIGHSQYDSPEVDQEILITSSKKIEPGSFVNVKITGSTEFDLYGEVT